MVVLDAMEKTAGVRVLQTELNDQPRRVPEAARVRWAMCRPRRRPRRRPRSAMQTHVDRARDPVARAGRGAAYEAPPISIR